MSYIGVFWIRSQPLTFMSAIPALLSLLPRERRLSPARTVPRRSDALSSLEQGRAETCTVCSLRSLGLAGELGGIEERGVLRAPEKL